MIIRRPPDRVLSPTRRAKVIADALQDRAEAYAAGGLERIVAGIEDPIEELRFTLALRDAPSLLDAVVVISKQDAANKARARHRPVQRDRGIDRDPGQPAGSMAWV